MAGLSAPLSFRLHRQSSFQALPPPVRSPHTPICTGQAPRPLHQHSRHPRVCPPSGLLPKLLGSIALPHAINGSIGRSINRSIGRSFNRSINRSIGRAFNRSINRSIDHSTAVPRPPDKPWPAISQTLSGDGVSIDRAELEAELEPALPAAGGATRCESRGDGPPVTDGEHARDMRHGGAAMEGL